MGQWRVAQVVFFRNLPRSLETRSIQLDLPECVTLWHHKDTLRSRECCYFLNMRPVNCVNSDTRFLFYLWLPFSCISIPPSTLHPEVSQAPQPSGREPDLKFVHPSLGGLLKKPRLFFCKAQHLACAFIRRKKLTGQQRQADPAWTRFSGDLEVRACSWSRLTGDGSKTGLR